MWSSLVPGLFPVCPNEFRVFPVFRTSCVDFYNRNPSALLYVQLLGTPGTVGKGLKRHEIGLSRPRNQTRNTGNEPVEEKIPDGGPATEARGDALLSTVDGEQAGPLPYVIPTSIDTEFAASSPLSEGLVTGKNDAVFFAKELDEAKHILRQALKEPLQCESDHSSLFVQLVDDQTGIQVVHSAEECGRPSWRTEASGQSRRC